MTAVVRTEHLTADEIEFMRWRAERWLKARHVPAVLRHYPRFVLRHAPAMLAHTFRGSTWRSALGLEDSRTVFARYKAIRRAERQNLNQKESRRGGDPGTRDLGARGPGPGLPRDLGLAIND